MSEQRQIAILDLTAGDPAVVIYEDDLRILRAWQHAASQEYDNNVEGVAKKLGANLPPGWLKALTEIYGIDADGVDREPRSLTPDEYPNLTRRLAERALSEVFHDFEPEDADGLMKDFTALEIKELQSPPSRPEAVPTEAANKDKHTTPESLSPDQDDYDQVALIRELTELAKEHGVAGRKVDLGGLEAALGHMGDQDRAKHEDLPEVPTSHPGDSAGRIMGHHGENPEDYEDL